MSFPSKQSRGYLPSPLSLSIMFTARICCHHSLVTHFIIMEYPALAGLHLSSNRGTKLGEFQEVEKEGHLSPCGWDD